MFTLPQPSVCLSEIRPDLFCRLSQASRFSCAAGSLFPGAYSSRRRFRSGMPAGGKVSPHPLLPRINLVQLFPVDSGLEALIFNDSGADKYALKLTLFLMAIPYLCQSRNL